MHSFVVFISLISLTSLSFAGAAAGCNGNDALCPRKYSNVTMIGTHNSAFTGKGMADNQNVGLVEQLDRGVRFLQAQAHDRAGELHLCHTNCVIRDAGRLRDYLKLVADWMSAEGHEREVVTLLLTNIQHVSVKKFDDDFKAVGLDRFVFQPDEKQQQDMGLDGWPTLEHMIDANTRLVVFMDMATDTVAVPYILNEWEFMWETAFGETDPDFPDCDLHRSEDADTARTMSLVNHVLNQQLIPESLNFLHINGGEGLVIPDPDAADETNSESSLMKQAGLCIGKYGRAPNVLLIDWLASGQPMKVQDILNGFV